MERLQCGHDLLHEVQVDRPATARIYISLGLAHAEVHGFVRADVEERSGILCRELCELLRDERDRACLTGREHCAVRRFRQRRILFPGQGVVQMAERLLLRHDGDVVGARVSHQGGRIGRADAAAGRRDEGI